MLLGVVGLMVVVGGSLFGVGVNVVGGMVGVVGLLLMMGVNLMVMVVNVVGMLVGMVFGFVLSLLVMLYLGNSLLNNLFVLVMMLF